MTINGDHAPMTGWVAISCPGKSSSLDMIGSVVMFYLLWLTGTAADTAAPWAHRYIPVDIADC